MFKFFKEKIKSWVKKSKEEVEEKAEKIEEPTEEKTEEEVKEIKKESAKPKEVKKEKKKSKKKKEEKAEPPKEVKKAEEILEKVEEEEEKLEEPKKEKETSFEKIKNWITGKERVVEGEVKKDEEEIKPKEEVKEKTIEIKEGKAEEVEEIEKKVKEQEQSVKEPKKEEEEAEEVKEEEEKPEEKIEEKEKPKTIFKKLKERFSYKLSEEDFDNIFEDLELMLLENNVALEATEAIKKNLKEELVGKEIEKEKLEEEIKEALKKSIDSILIEPDDVLSLIKEKKPFVMVFFGINGTGKTTTIAKVANLLLKNKISCVLAAADTFRAASIEQIQHHADKLNLKIIKHDYGADPAAVAFDAIKHARAHNIDAVLIDTAGRMHTSGNLLSEMGKICRIADPDLKIFVAESIAGNDATNQARNFNEKIGIDGSILTKADVDEKGGTTISISHITKKPILFLGTGQEYKDIEVFNKEKFIENLGL